MLLSGMATWEHALKEAELCNRQLTEQQNSKYCEMLGHPSYRRELRFEVVGVIELGRDTLVINSLRC